MVHKPLDRTTGCLLGTNEYHNCEVVYLTIGQSKNLVHWRRQITRRLSPPTSGGAVFGLGGFKTRNELLSSLANSRQQQSVFLL